MPIKYFPANRQRLNSPGSMPRVRGDMLEIFTGLTASVGYVSY